MHTGVVPAVCGSDSAIRADGAFVLDLVKVRGGLGLGLGLGVRVRFRARVTLEPLHAPGQDVSEQVCK